MDEQITFYRVYDPAINQYLSKGTASITGGYQKRNILTTFWVRKSSLSQFLNRLGKNARDRVEIHEVIVIRKDTIG